MRKVILTLLVSLLGFNLGGSLAYADGIILPETASPDYLVVRYHQVTVNINNGHAVTRVEQAFYNPNPFPVSGRYLFPMPPEAIISRFQATLDRQPQAVTHQDSTATNAALYDMVAQRHDPSLLQYADWESLAFDLNMPPGSSRQMSLEYEEALAPSGGLYRYRYVLSTERYSSLPLEEVSLTVNLYSPDGLSSLYSPTHEITTEWSEPGRARVSWQAQNVNPSEDFELFFAPAEGGFGGGLLTGQRDEQNHLLFLFAPEAEQVSSSAIPKDIVFVFDRSGSMEGEKIRQARNALRFILNQLDQTDRFSIVGFDQQLSLFAPTLQPVGRQNLSDAHHFVERLTADGSTDLEAALQAGLKILADSEGRDATSMVIFLTDGLPTAGVTDEGAIARLVAEANTRQAARLHIFGVGYDVNTHLLDRLASDNSGSVTYVQPGENLELVLTDFYKQIAHPVLTDVTVEFEGLAVSDIYPRQMPDMFRGSSLLLTGRYRATAPTVTVRVRGQAAGQPRSYVYHFELAQTGNHDFVPRLWATRRVGELLDRVRVEGESPALVDEVRELGLGYGLVTPYTTFAIEAQAEGAASADNMSLYRQEGLNLAWGRTTIQARVQNQRYQQAERANLAGGANVVNNGQRSLVQVTGQNVDLSLLRGQKNINGPITAVWLEQNIKIDRHVAFGSADYFALAEDPALRPFLQSGSNVVFTYQGQVIAVRDAEAPPPPPHQSPVNQMPSRSTRDQGAGFGIFSWFGQLLGLGGRSG